MNLNKKSSARLYALTAIACTAWLVQSLMQANADGSLTNWATIVFSLCLLVVIGWTAYNAITGWNAKDDDENGNGGAGSDDSGDDSGDDDAHGNAPENNRRRIRGKRVHY